MAAEVTELCGPKHHPNDSGNVRAGSSSGRVIAYDQREEIESTLEITCSLGVHQLLPNQPFSVGVDYADKALYQAKAAGRNRVEAFTDGSEQERQENCQQTSN